MRKAIVFVICSLFVTAPAYAQSGQTYFARQTLKPVTEAPVVPAAPTGPVVPNYTGKSCGDLVGGWKPASMVGAIKIFDIYYGNAAQNALMAKRICAVNMTGPGVCFIVAGQFTGLSTVYRTSSTAMVPSTNPTEEYAINCNAP